MIYRLHVPATIEDNDAVRVLEWHGHPGDLFEPGALIVEVETHKALIEVRAAQRGILRRCAADADDWCALGTLLALFSDMPDEPLEGAAAELAAEFLIG